MNQSLMHTGMPKLIHGKKITSFFEFWPNWLIYAPVAVQWLTLAGRYKGLTLPLIANPKIYLAGMVGESKSDILNLAGNTAKKVIAPWVVISKDSENVEETLHSALNMMQQNNLSFPVVVKPDQGSRGAGVWKVNDVNRLAHYIEVFPLNQKFIIQKLSVYEPEAGIFYVRMPNESSGTIISITLKYQPIVIGDGRFSLRQLILRDPRASLLTNKYFPRVESRLDQVIPKGEQVVLGFAGNHCRGAIFRNGNAHITSELIAAIDAVLKDVEGFHYGRLDVRFRDIHALEAGQDFEIIEINGASSECTHIWDAQTKIFEVYQALFQQYRLLFEIGSQLRKQGLKVPSILQLIKAWLQDSALVKKYPEAD